jgi:AcrR family transcriptional regulator
VDLLLRARILFLEHGYHETTVRQLCSALATNEHDLYARFGTKADLARAVVRLEGRLAARRILAWSRVGDARRHLKGLLAEVLGEQRRPGGPPGYVMMNLACDLSDSDPTLREKVAAVHASIARCLEQALIAIAPNSDERAQARRQALFLLGSFFGAVLLARTDSDAWELESGVRLLERYIDTL